MRIFWGLGIFRRGRGVGYFRIFCMFILVIKLYFMYKSCLINNKNNFFECIMYVGFNDNFIFL